MKTTLDLPDAILRDAKATAALRGESLRDFVAAALEAWLGAQKAAAPRSGWRTVFGVARSADVAAVDRVVRREFESVNPADWR